MNRAPKANAAEAFNKLPIPKLVIRNSLPALIAMVMVMVYNLADIFFIGKTNDPLQVAAVSLGSPVFMIFMSFGTLFGVGGTSVISRALGAGKTEYAKSVSSFCLWACVALGILFTGILWLWLDPFMVMLGASPKTLAYTKDYLSIVVGCGVFSMISSCFSSILRTEGESMKAMTGTLIGNLLNLVLDPIMILALGWGIRGAAIATVIGNVASAAYYLLHFLTKKSSLSIHPKYFSMKDGILTGVVGIGISASLSNLMASVTAILVNGQLARYQNDMAVAGYGVASKVLMIITLIGIGIGSGVQPLIGYFFGSKNRERLMKTVRFSALFGLAICLAVSVLCFVFADGIVNVFLTVEEAAEPGVHFTKILLSTAWLIGAFAIFQNSLQAMGNAVPALLSTLLRQIVIFIPALFLLKSFIGMDGLIWAQPVADVLSLVIVALMFLGCLKKSLPDTGKHSEA